MSFESFCAAGIILGLFVAFPLLVVYTCDFYRTERETKRGLAAIALVVVLIFICTYGFDHAGTALPNDQEERCGCCEHQHK